MQNRRRRSEVDPNLQPLLALTQLELQLVQLCPVCILMPEELVQLVSMPGEPIDSASEFLLVKGCGLLALGESVDSICELLKRVLEVAKRTPGAVSPASSGHE